MSGPVPCRWPPPPGIGGLGLRHGPGYRLLRFLVRGLLRVGWHLQVEGLARLPRAVCILVPNHPSEIDPIILSAVLPFRPTFVASRHLEQFPVIFWLMQRFNNPVLVRREIIDIGAIKASLARLARGEFLVIFPEGRVIQDQPLGPLHAGAAFVAIRAQVPIVPVALIGLAKMWPLGARWPRRSHLTIRIGEPVTPPAENGDHAADVTEAIGRALRILLERAPTGTPG